jgi:hypothetical protein
VARQREPEVVELVGTHDRRPASRDVREHPGRRGTRPPDIPERQE